MRPRLVSDIEIYPVLLSIRLKISFREGSLFWPSRYSKIEPCAPTSGSAVFIHNKAGTNDQFQSISKITKVIPLEKISSEETNMLVWKFSYFFVPFFLLHMQIVEIQASNTTTTLLVYIFALPIKIVELVINRSIFLFDEHFWLYMFTQFLLTFLQWIPSFLYTAHCFYSLFTWTKDE